MIPDHVLSSLVIYLQPSSRRQPCFLEKNNSTSLRKTPASSNSSLLPSALSPNSFNNDELQQDPLVTRCLTLSTMILAITVQLRLPGLPSSTYKELPPQELLCRRQPCRHNESLFSIRSFKSTAHTNCYNRVSS